MERGYLAVQSAWFQEFKIKYLDALQDCYTVEEKLGGELVLLGDPTIWLQIEGVEEKK